MTVTIHIPSTLRTYAQDETAELAVSASTVRSALKKLAESHESIYHGVCDETGAVRRHVNLFVNDSLLRREDLDTELQTNDVLTIMPAVSGG